MQNIDIRFEASSNFRKVQADLAALDAQARKLESTMAGSYAKGPALVDPRAWKRGSEAVSEASRIYRQAASSSNLLNTQQIRTTSQTEKFTEALQKQKLSLRDMIKNQGIMRKVYQDQLRIQRMTAQYWGTDMKGRGVTDITTPKNVPRDLDTMRRRMGMFGNMVGSASQQMVNLGKNIQWSGRQLMVGFTYPMVLFGAAAGVAAYKTEAAFAKINKVYDVSGGANASEAQRTAELNKLRADSMDLAGEAAARYGSKLQDTLKVEQELAATGLRGSKLLSSTGEVQRISALGDIDPEATTQMVISLQNAFRKTIPDAAALTNTLNFMNATSNATSLSLQDIAEATPRAASGLSQLGVTAQEMTIMLVSMRENGVDAAEAANALKSATTRILNPVSKASKYYKQFGIDLQSLRDKSGGNLYEFLQLLGAEQDKIVGKTEKQTNQMRASGVAALFGTYQYNRLFAALTNTTDALGGVNNQTKKAQELQKLSNEELARQAKISEDLMMKNPAGRLRASWAKFLKELSEMGKPFLEVATKVVDGLSNIADGFNGMSDWKKKAIIVAVGLLAIVGPVVMLTGLFLNLIGQFGKGVGVIARFLGVSTLLTKQQQAEALATEAQNKAYQRQTAAVNTLALEVMALTEAYQLANAAATGRVGRTGAAGVPSSVMNSSLTTATNGTVRVPTAPAGPASAPIIPPMISYQTTDRSLRGRQEAGARARAEAIRQQERLNERVATNARIQEKVRASVNATTAGTVAMGAAMALMIAPGNQTTHNMGQWLMLTSLALPAMAALKGMYVGINTAIKESIVLERAAAAARTMGTASAGGAALATLRGVGAGVAGLMGPVGWATLGVAAVGAGLFMWHKHIKKARQEQIRFDKSINDTAKEWTKNLGLVKTEYEGILIAANKISNVQQFQAYKDAYKKDGKKNQSLKDFQDLGDEGQSNYATQHFLELMAEYKMTAADAGLSVKALYSVAGLGADEANKKVKQLTDTYGDLNKQTLLTMYASNQFNIFSSKEQGSEEAAAAGKDYVAAFERALKAGTPDAAKGMMDAFENNVNSQFDTAFEKLDGNKSGRMQEAFKELGITSGKTFREYLEKNNLDGKEFMSRFIGAGGVKGDEVKNYTDDVLANVNVLYDELANNENLPFGEAWKDGSIDRLADIRASIDKFFPGKLTSYGDILPKAQEFKATLDAMNNPLTNTSDLMQQSLTSFDGMNQEAARQLINITNANYGWAEGKTLAEALAIFLSRGKSEAAGLAGAARSAASALNSVPTSIDVEYDINKEESIGAFRTSMAALQEQIASDREAAFDRGWDNRIAAEEAGQQRLEDIQKEAEDRMAQRHKDAEQRMADSHKASLARIQKQIDAEGKANDRRQAMYEAEKKRLEDIANIKNRQIDFDQAVAEGRLDDAAKIQNDALAATASGQIDKDAAAAEAASKKRIDAMEARSERLEKIYENMERSMAKAHERAEKNLSKAHARQNEAHAAYMKNLQSERDYQRKTLEATLTLFKSNTATSKSDLERWMKEVGISYDEFGKGVRGRAKSWSEYYRNTMVEQMRLAANEIKTDKVWKGITKAMVTGMFKDIGFKGINEFNKFVNTGELPKNFGKNPETRHGGGVIGGAGSSRGNIPNTYKGLHRTERMVRAQDGEFMVKRTMAKKYPGLLHDINNDQLGHDGVMGGLAAPAGGLTPSFSPLFGVSAGAIGRLFSSGLGKAMSEGIRNRAGQATIGQNATGSNFFSGVLGALSGAFQPGRGGRHRPINSVATSGVHDQSTGYPALDFATPRGTPIYSVADGVISRSYDIPGPKSTDRFKGDGPYGSYGKVIYLKTNGGPEVLYAHLSQRAVGAGKSVPGGSVIGYSGNTGNSSGPHLHFGATNGPAAWLRNGGTVKWDNTPAILHRGETVLTEPLTSQLKDNVASGGGDRYDITLDLRGAYIKEYVDIERALDTWWEKKETKVGRKRVVK